ncbi:MAG: uroporphyrinogen-III C-methyltransferase [Bacteroidales bacterium]|uniref:uroporphyrinogen-III C-methyltransferase n=1 Tax=Porphyromonas sp. TaxID=1924944 RepID=UPI0029712D0D|nr:uroporphyrinogen-III C-methyltransferase [Porphyromonas sp.]MDD7437392.1 uroporphyrinogen-III C-methyltransferase [Bacteroidales bacterium]MDY3067936.1 uroporphyrinogen-III C-methyltransferase [Porphyromonas sp.]
MDNHFFAYRRLVLVFLLVVILGINRAIAQEGVVYLVGAGPGDPDLISLKGIKALRKADVVLYDALANPEILLHCRKDVRLIPVGKRAGRPSLKQEEINQLLISEAKNGHCVVRLKGGDPFVFGRGGEELLALCERKIEVRVIPGITAAIAAPAYAGIPVTHRGLARSFTLVTASTKDQDLNDAVQWKSLVNLGGTVAFYMGARIVPEICQTLISEGLSPETPAAIISNGTLTSQKVLRGRLKDFTPTYIDYGKLTPALLLVGEVVEVTPEQLDPTPKDEIKVLAVTLNRKISELTPRIEGEVALTETFTSNTPDVYSLDYLQLLKSVGFTHIVFSNTKSVEAYFKLCEQKGVNIIGENTLLITLGEAITQKLRDYGYDAVTVKSYNEVAEYLIGDKALLLPSKYDAVSGATKTVTK